MTFDEWFAGEQGTPYDSMYVFSKAAWSAATATEREAIIELAENQRWAMRDDSAFEDAVREICDMRTPTGNPTSTPPGDLVCNNKTAIEATSLEWQPIETAPRNSSRVIVAYKNAFDEWVVREAWWRIPYESAPDIRGYWSHDGDRILLDASVHDGIGATHWMPLPAPPSCAT